MKLKYYSLTSFGKLSLLILILTFCVGLPTYYIIMNPYRVMKRAFKHLDYDKLQWAIDHGVDVNAFVDKTRPISLAFEKGRHDFLEALCKAGADVNLTTSHGTSFVGKVAERGDSTALEILGTYGADFHTKADTIGRNTLTHILATQKRSLLNVALKYTERNRRDDNGGRTPAHYADQIDDETLTLLVNAGENPDATDYLGNTPMHTVKTVRAAKTLHALGADINATNNCGIPALFYQVGLGNGAIYQYMMQNGAEVDRTDDYGHGLLIYAMMTENELLHRQASDNYCQFYPEKCEKAKKHLKNAGIKGLATLIYTKTAHKAIMGRIAASQAAKSAVRRGAMRAAGKRLFWRIIPFVGWGSLLYDAAKIAEEVEAYNRQIREHEAEADRLAAKRKEAQQQLRDQFLNCDVQIIPHAKADTTAVVSAY